MDGFFLYAGILVIAPFVGSFITVLVYRLPIMFGDVASDVSMDEFGIDFPSSHCTHCSHPLSWWQNIPLFSFFLLRRRCSYCHKAISWTYPLYELGALLVALLVFLVFGFNAKSIVLVLFIWFSIPIVILDYQYYLLPDCLSLSLLWTGMLLSLTGLTCSSDQAIIGACVGYLILFIPSKIYSYMRKENGMGYGDFKLNAALNAWLGYHTLFLLLFIACGIALLAGLPKMIARRQVVGIRIPFGPCLMISGIAVFLFIHENFLL